MQTQKFVLTLFRGIKYYIPPKQGQYKNDTKMSEVLQAIVIFVKNLLKFVDICSAENQQSASSNRHFCEKFVDWRGSGVAAGPRPAFGRPRTG